MPELLPMKRTEGRRGESVLSLFFGAPSLGIAMAALILLVSSLIDYPVGPSQFTEIAVLRAEPSGSGSYKLTTCVLPSMQLLGMLFAGLGLGCVGMLVGHRRRRNRGMVTCIAGTIGCALALGLAWILYVRAALG